MHTPPHTFSRLLPKFLTASKSFLIFSCSKVAYAKLLFNKKTHLKILKTNKYLHVNQISSEFFFRFLFFWFECMCMSKIVLIALVFIQTLKRFFSFCWWSHRCWFYYGQNKISTYDRNKLFWFWMQATHCARA